MSDFAHLTTQKRDIEDCYHWVVVAMALVA